MKNKKFYWLKLRDEFFNQKEIKKLRKIAGGDTYTIIYLKMQLISLKNNGSLFYEGFEDDFCQELALELDEEPENVKVTLLYLEKYGLIEQVVNPNVDEFTLPAVKENTGSETNKAEAMRRLRQKRKEENKQIKNNDDKKVTLLPSVTKCYTEIERREREEKEKDIEREKRKRFKPPCYDEILIYCNEKEIKIDIDRFIDYYTSNGWKVGGKAKMKDWKASVRNWARRQEVFNSNNSETEYEKYIKNKRETKDA